MTSIPSSTPDTTRNDPTPPPCQTCGHAYGDHTGRSLGWNAGRRRDGDPAVGPPDRFHWGGGCSVRVDWHHTCPCAEWAITVNGRRETQRSLLSVLDDTTRNDR
jgi:hypothetical protein